jgi:uncharacterized protein involved in tellurium resistance
MKHFMLLLVFTASMFAANQDGYHKVDIRTFAGGGSIWTHVKVSGTVVAVHHEKDGDVHIKVCERSGEKSWCFIAEIMPEFGQIKAPKRGQDVTLYGVSRYDRKHKWWEIHPVRKIE